MSKKTHSISAKYHIDAFSEFEPGSRKKDFGFIGNRGKEYDRYISAIQKGLKRDYKLMKAIIEKGLKLAAKLASLA